MSDPVKNQGTEITGNDAQDLEVLVRKAVEEAYAKTNKPESIINDPAHKPEPIKVKIFGDEVSFDNPEAMAKAVETAILRTRESTLAEAAAARGQEQQQQQVPGTTKNSFDKDKFAELIADDTLKGLNYALSHLMFNGQVEDAAGAIRSRFNDLDTQKQVLAAYQFREMFPQFQADPVTINKLDQIRQGLNLPPDNPQSWEAALALGVVRGILPDPRVQQQQQQTQRQQQQQFTGPPTMGRGNSEPPPDWLAKLENLSEAELEQAAAQFSRR